VVFALTSCGSACRSSARTLKANGHDVVICHPHLAPIDWDDVYSADLVGISRHDLYHTGPRMRRDDLRLAGIRS